MTPLHLIVSTPPFPRQAFCTLTLPPRPLPDAQTRLVAIPKPHGASPLHRVDSSVVELPAEQQPHGGPGRRDVDDGVPEAHEREDDTGGVGEGEGDEGGVDERVDAVDRRGDLSI